MSASYNDFHIVPQPGKLILIRHGQSVWNLENRFTGWANIPLTDKGREEAQDAAETLLSEDFEIDACYTSMLSRSIDTADICLDAWEKAGRRRPEMKTRWRLNERHYGMLTGLDKRQVLKQFPESDLKRWRSTFEGKPPPMEPDHPYYSRTPWRLERLLAARTQRQNEPNITVFSMRDVPLTESLADTQTRVAVLWNDELQPLIMSGKNVLIVGHANCLRALVSCIQGNLNDQDLPSLGLPNAFPLVYEFDEQGAPVRNNDDCYYIGPLDARYIGEECVIFNEIDADGSGAIDASEFDRSDVCRVALEDYVASMGGTGLPDICGEEFILEADNNKDGQVNFNEFMNWCNKYSPKSID